MSEDHSGNDSTEFQPVLVRGTMVSHYRVVNRIGKGGMGEVYLAIDTQLGRQVALKFLSPKFSSDPRILNQFRQEAKAATLKNDYVAQIYEISEHVGRPFISMEYVEGESLQKILDRRPMSADEAVRMGVQICEGLKALHRAGVNHLDLKPENILIDNRQGLPKIIDLGLSKIKGQTDSGIWGGTPAYMSPEQKKGSDVDWRSDIYTFGVLFSEMIAGRLPAQDLEPPEVGGRISEGKSHLRPRLPSAVPRRHSKVISRCLNQNRDDRYQSVADLQSDLKELSSKKSNWGMALIAPALIVAAAILLLSLPEVRDPLLRLLGFKTVPEEKRLVVLPFRNVGDNQEDQSFCDGLLEAITSKLTQLEQFHNSLWIVPSIEIRQGRIASVHEARRAFNVNLVVTGSVQLGAGQLRMILDLVDAKEERQLRSSMFDISESELPTVPDSAIVRLADMLEVELMPDQKQLVLAEGTTAERAYDLYLRGRGYLQRFREAGTIDTAIMMLKEAAAVDSNFAGAYAALGEAYWRKYESDKDTAYVGLAKTSCQRSLDLDEQLTDVHLTLGLIHSGTGFYIEAIREFRQALTLDSTYYEAYRGLHDAYASLNRLQDAEDALKKAILLKRDYWLGHRDLGYFYSRYGRKEEALKQLIKVVELLPENYRSLNDLGGLYYELDSLDKARDFFMRSLALERNYGAASNLGSIYYLEGRYTDASDMYEIALSIDGSDYQVWGNLAMAYYWIPRKRDEAKRAFSTAAAMAEEQRIINPRNPTIIMDLATYYSGMDELTKARPLVFEALTLDPDNRDMMVNVGLFYLQVGTNDSALSYFEMAIERGCPVNQITSLPELQELRNDKMFSRLFNAALRDTSMR